MEIDKPKIGPHARAKINQKSQAADEMLTATVKALQDAAWPHEQADDRAARELMIRAWDLLGDVAFCERCKAYVRSLEASAERDVQALASDLTKA